MKYLEVKSTPIVEALDASNSFRVYLRIKLLFPTPESPTIITIILYILYLILCIVIHKISNILPRNK
jgi:hypothetical protein